MIALIDNDVILKLAKWDLLYELVEMFGGGIENIYHLPTCKYVLCSPNKPEKALKRCGDQITIERILSFCASTKPIPQPNELIWLDKLNKIQEIDSGEVLIFAIGAESCESLLYIGDKRSIVALARSIEVKDIVFKLENRIKCLEQVLAEMICVYGVAAVRNKITSCVTADTAIRIVFGLPGTEKKETVLWNGLLAYYTDLNRCADNLLAHFPVAPEFILNAPHTEIEALQTG